MSWPVRNGTITASTRSSVEGAVEHRLHARPRSRRRCRRRAGRRARAAARRPRRARRSPASRSRGSRRRRRPCRPGGRATSPCTNSTTSLHAGQRERLARQRRLRVQHLEGRHAPAGLAAGERQPQRRVAGAGADLDPAPGRRARREDRHEPADVARHLPQALEPLRPVAAVARVHLLELAPCARSTASGTSWNTGAAFPRQALRARREIVALVIGAPVAVVRQSSGDPRTNSRSVAESSCSQASASVAARKPSRRSSRIGPLVRGLRRGQEAGDAAGGPQVVDHGLRRLDSRYPRPQLSRART